jgi:ribosomal protein L10
MISMSKVIKQMQMDAMKESFNGVRDLVLLNVVGLDAVSENQIRLNLRKKNIRLHTVKNSLAQKVFTGMGLSVTAGWEGSTTVAWGGNSIADLSKELEPIVKKHEKKMKVKSAVADGETITFEAALKRPTREEALGRVSMMVMAPARRVAAQIIGPASQVCGQIKGIKDTKKDEAPVEAPAPA